MLSKEYIRLDTTKANRVRILSKMPGSVVGRNGDLAVYNTNTGARLCVKHAGKWFTVGILEPITATGTGKNRAPTEDKEFRRVRAFGNLVAPTEQIANAPPGSVRVDIANNDLDFNVGTAGWFKIGGASTSSSTPTYSSSTADRPLLSLINKTNDGQGPIIVLTNDKGSTDPLDGDECGEIRFKANNSNPVANGNTVYAAIIGKVESPVDGSERGELVFRVADKTTGALIDALAITGTSIDGIVNVSINGYLDLGGATDTTISRASAGDVNIEGNIVYRAGGTDVPVADGGTGASDATAARGNLGLGAADNVSFAKVSASGGVDVDATSDFKFDGASGHTYMVESSDDILDVYVGGDNVMKIDEGSNKLSFPVGLKEVHSGYHGNLTRLKILPSDFISGSSRATIADTGTGGVKPGANSVKLYATVPIPTGYKATKVDIWGNNTKGFVVYETNINSGTTISKGTGTIGTQFDITDVSSTKDNFLFIEAQLTLSTDIIYGGAVTIAAI